jgi:hypothetical protein
LIVSITVTDHRAGQNCLPKRVAVKVAQNAFLLKVNVLHELNVDTELSLDQKFNAQQFFPIDSKGEIEIVACNKAVLKNRQFENSLINTISRANI